MSAPVPNLFKKIYLRRIYSGAKAAGVALKTALETAGAEAVESSTSSTVLAGTSANGASVSYAVNAASGIIPPSARAELAEELLEIYEYFEAAADSSLEESALEEFIFRAMLDYLSRGGLRRIKADWSGLVK